MVSERQCALQILCLPGITPALMGAIYQRFGSFAAFLSAQRGNAPAALDSLLRCYDKNPALYQQQADALADQLEQQGIIPLAISEDDYPALLREINRPPPLLYVTGSLPQLSLPQIAIVGSRRASRGALEDARAFAADLAASGFAVTSGLALGIDGAAHRGALATGTTIAVVGTGLDVMYPRQHAALRDEILATGGAIVSEFPLGFGVRAENFPQRNRIISGLSLGVLVVEAALRSGSLITARLAMEQGREVFAVPGSIHNPQVKGCHQLIREGAMLVETSLDIVSQLGGMLAYKVEEAAVGRSELPAGEAAVLAAMGFDPVDMDTLLARVGMEVPQLAALLLNLELLGRVENRGGSYLRIR
ncbi:MAG: hypothetical protein VR73_02615 [Gammaproteobacteria bacterium BRH_c0]|nr:MAG: hypothetical protein VR73_02615 [Gammaproteobacteria bacterium BRH_c0]